MQGEALELTSRSVLRKGGALEIRLPVMGAWLQPAEWGEVGRAGSRDSGTRGAKPRVSAASGLPPCPFKFILHKVRRTCFCL